MSALPPRVGTAIFVATTIGALSLRPASIEPNWVLVANMATLPLALAVGVATLMLRSNWGLALCGVVLLLSPWLVHPVLTAPLLVCAAVVIVRSVVSCVDGSSLFWSRS